VQGRELLVEAVVHVACKFLDETAKGRTDESTNGRKGKRAKRGGNGAEGPHGDQSGAAGVVSGARCRAHGFEGRIPAATQNGRPAVRNGPDRFTVMQGRTLHEVTLHPPRRRRSLPVLEGPNPCATAPCRTADHTRGAACCRDLTLDVVAPLGTTERLESLLRARRSPYVCKVRRSNETTLECEVISACNYLGDDGYSCVLHGRLRPDGRPAKPSICSDWPDPEDEESTYHPGCVFA
jgi:hypothetical protein